eukprot:scaffold2003_cov139-Cylindrotheca_fusiformis.AAC.15
MIKCFAIFVALASAFFIHVDCFSVNKLHQRDATQLAASPRLKATRQGNTVGGEPSRMNRKQLYRAIQSIEYYGQKESDGEYPSGELLEAMRMLSQAKTQKDVVAVGKLLERMDITNNESRQIQERVVKVTSLSGLLSTSLRIIRNMLGSSYLPSSMAYTSVCSALRKAGRKRQLEELMLDLADVARKCKSSIDVVAWNIYVATLCSGIGHSMDPMLAEVWSWMDPDTANERFCVQPDLVSHNTVLATAARVGNSSLVDSIWRIMKEHNDFQPDIRAYNSRLMVVDGPERLQIFDEIKNTANITPDRFTIDLLIHDLVEANLLDELEALMRNFIASSSEQAASDAFSAFLITLVRKGNANSARALFDTYIADESPYFSVAPDTRHFNVLIGGYRDLAELRSEQNHENTGLGSQIDVQPKLFAGEQDLDMVVARTEGRKLYRQMVQRGISPDSYTLSSMMGLCVSSRELIKLMEQSSASLTAVVIRSAITQCGHFGDPSQACALFDQYAAGSMNIRLWNVLLGALAEGAKKNDIILDMESTQICNRGISRNETGICSIVNGLTCSAAARNLLSTMSSSIKPVKAPLPNSQSYCIAASALQHGSPCAGDAMDLFRNASSSGIPADGRFINAVFRCFGDDINAALKCWKEEIRKACLEHEIRTMQDLSATAYGSRNKNLVAAYNGLLYVCGRALRPDIAVRIVYAMNREGIEADNISLNNYKSGKRKKEALEAATDEETATGGKMWSKLLPKPNIIESYENLLYVECTKYDPKSRLMSADRLVRIIL